MQNVCERCKAGYITATDGLNCVCPPGFWHSCTGSNPTTCSCLACNKGMFCPGGVKQAKNYAPEDSKGLRHSCQEATVVPAGSAITTGTIQDAGLTTKSQAATRPQDCVPMPGFYLNTTSRATQKAALCPRSTYSPGYGRIRQCLKCQSGTEEKDTSGFADTLPASGALTADKLRSNRLTVCQVPSGRYLVQNVVRDCPAGSFRTGYSMTTESNSRYCFTCPPGVTTNGTRATSQADCKIVAPGVSMTYSTLESAQTLAAAGDNSLADNDVALCGYGTYWAGGLLDSTVGSTCKACPFGTTTQFTGATSVNDCQVPPGYYIKVAAGATTGTLETCPGNVTGQGYYRSGWTSYTDVKAQDTDGTTACTPCGAGITSALTDVAEQLGGNDTSLLVAGSSYSCFIEAGWGMVPAGVAADQTLQYKAVLCDNNTYGVANRTYGLQSTPCKPCQRNLITLSPGRTNYTECVNPDGFGYSPNGATACPPGSYAPQASMQGCIQCPAGRTTLTTQQISITDCVVDQGYGVYDGAATPSPWNPTIPSSDVGKANMTVMPCPVGYFGVGGALDSKCIKCSDDRTTQGEGSKSAAACDRCAAGYAFPSAGDTATCSQCPAGTYQPGYLGNDVSGANFGAGTTCLTCPTTRSVYISSKGKEAEYVSDPITYRKGASSRDECVPQDAQLGIDVGTKFFDIPASDTLLTTITNIPLPSTADACVTAACGSTDTCCFVQFDYAYRKNGTGGPADKTCKFVKMTAHATAGPPGTGDNLVYYKMLPSDAITAASLSTAAGKVEAKAMSSGLYARCTLPTTWADTSVYNSNGKLGKKLLPGVTLAPATSANGLAECKRRCDMMSICWGFTVKGGECTLRGGFDEMDVRSFFRNPSDPTTKNW